MNKCFAPSHLLLAPLNFKTSTNHNDIKASEILHDQIVQKECFVIENTLKEQSNPDKQLMLWSAAKRFSKRRRRSRNPSSRILSFESYEEEQRRHIVVVLGFFPQNDTGAIKNCKTAEDGKMISSN